MEKDGQLPPAPVDLAVETFSGNDEPLWFAWRKTGSCHVWCTKAKRRKVVRLEKDE